MKKILVIGAVLIGIWFTFKDCGLKSTHDNLEFEGVWVFNESSELSGARSEWTSQVWAKGNRFKIFTKSKEEGWGGQIIEIDKTTVYDGKKLHIKTEYSPHKDFQGNTQTAPPESSSRIPVNGELDGFRFWTKSVHGKSEAGGMVAGRETLLFSDNGERRDVKVIDQMWVDKQTDLLLRSVTALFSKQADVSMRKSTMECASLRFGNVSEDVFSFQENIAGEGG
jgi:hypothetical protein